MESGFRNFELADHRRESIGGPEFRIPNSEFRIIFFAVLLAVIGAVGCGKEGIPLPPEIRVAERTSDLEAFQEGETAVLRWSYPSMTTAGQALTDVEAVSVWRAALPKGQEPPPPMSAEDRQLRRQLLASQGEVIEVLDPEELQAATRGSDIVFRDDLVRWRADLEGDPDSMIIWYGVQTMCCRKRESEISNVVRIQPTRPPSPPEGLRLEAVSNGIDVFWDEVPEAETIVERSADGTVWKAVTDAAVEGGTWRDEQAAQGRGWSYRLRSVETLEGGANVVGEPSPPGRIDHPDTYPPHAPEGVVCLPEGASVRVRWQAVAGAATYQVSRRLGSDQPEILKADLASIEFTDNSQSQGELVYLVVAFDAVGNISQATSCTVVMGADP